MEWCYCEDRQCDPQVRRCPFAQGVSVNDFCHKDTHNFCIHTYLHIYIYIQRERRENDDDDDDDEDEEVNKLKGREKS